MDRGYSPWGCKETDVTEENEQACSHSTNITNYQQYTQYLQHQDQRQRLSELISCSPLWQPTPVFLPGESQGRRSLVGCRLWGRTELDTTEAT